MTDKWAVPFESDSEKWDREYRLGQRAGADASGTDKLFHSLAGGGDSEAYNKGWENGIANPSSEDDD